MSRLVFSVWFRIQCIFKKCPGYYSAYGSGFNFLFKMFRVLFSVRFRIQRIIKKCPGYYSASGSGSIVFFLKMSKVLFSVWFSIQRIIKRCPGYYSAFGSGFSVLLKNVQGIIQRMVQDSTYYSKLSRVLFSIWFSFQRNIEKCSGYYSA